MKPWSQYRSFIMDRDLTDEIRDLASKGQLRAVKQRRLDPRELEEHLAEETRVPRLERLEAPTLEERPPLVRPPLVRPPQPSISSLEAIVLDYGRPSLLIRDGTFEVPESPLWKQTLAMSRSRIEEAITRVGRVELLNHFTMDWVGTAWLVDRNVVITNRHVAEVFGARDNAGKIVFRKNILGIPLAAKIDFREEYENPEVAEVRVQSVLYIAASDEPDIALLKLDAQVPLPDPIPLSSRDVQERQFIGVIGYPAFDSRNPVGPMRRYFEEIYDVKRFAPGKISFEVPNEHYFIHDCTTLGGNSGSKVIELDSGEAVGLHFAGRYGEGNFAVKTLFIREALAKVRITVPAPPAPEELPQADGEHPPDYFAGRDGFVADFLGSEALSVPLPDLGRWEADAAPVEDAPDEQPYALRYRHFSVTLSKSRKLPIFTAVNINGDEARRVYRQGRDEWFIDERIDSEYQTGNELYRSNDLDRGHMVRREDPVWGSKETAKEANEDTFHYTNAVPQHKDLNQKTWLNLENFVLKYARADRLRISVFTGPVLDPADRPYRSVKLPREFWKIIVFADEDAKDLKAVGFVLTHSHLIRNLEEAVFIPNNLQVHQRTIKDISELTGLDFKHLVDCDPLGAIPPEEAAEVSPKVLIESGSEMILR
jgi:endonuclease G